MADWEYEPNHGYEVETRAPRVVDHEYADKFVQRRKKGTVSKRTFSGEFVFSVEDSKVALDLLHARYPSTSLTILTNDPRAVDPDTDSATVLVAELPTPRRTSFNRVEFPVRFLET